MKKDCNFELLEPATTQRQMVKDINDLVRILNLARNRETTLGILKSIKKTIAYLERDLNSEKNGTL